MFTGGTLSDRYWELLPEDCSYCHEPHGTVANNLLRQPTTFLCLRCHTGHRRNNHGAYPAHYDAGGTTNERGSRVDIDQNPALRQAYYADCTQCHTQIHGSDLPSQHVGGLMLR